MKKTIYILLLALIGLGITGPYTVFVIMQMEAKNSMALEIASGISEDKLERFINLPASDNNTFQWEEKDKEFRIGDKVYDVVRIEVQGNKKTYYCIADTKEENNCSSFAKLFNNKKSHHDEGSLLKHLLKIFLLDYNITARSVAPVIALQLSATTHTLPPFLYHLHDCSVPSPPPWGLS